MGQNSLINQIASQGAGHLLIALSGTSSVCAVVQGKYVFRELVQILFIWMENIFMVRPRKKNAV